MEPALKIQHRAEERRGRRIIRVYVTKKRLGRKMMIWRAIYRRGEEETLSVFDIWPSTGGKIFWRTFSINRVATQKNYELFFMNYELWKKNYGPFNCYFWDTLNKEGGFKSLLLIGLLTLGWGITFYKESLQVNLNPSFCSLLKWLLMRAKPV